jgi:isocitrate lyase
MLALAQVQRKVRLLESPYRTPQTHVGGPRLDAALAASSARTATTKAMGKGSTQVQHLAQTELPKKVLEDWLAEWRQVYGFKEPLTVRLRPSREGADVLELSVLGVGGDDDRKANLIFARITDRHGQVILSVRDQNTFGSELRQKRLMTLLHLYVLKRYRVSTVHYVTPTEDNDNQAKRMAEQGIYSNVNTEVGQIIVAKVNTTMVDTLADDVGGALSKLIRKES